MMSDVLARMTQIDFVSSGRPPAGVPWSFQLQLMVFITMALQSWSVFELQLKALQEKPGGETQTFTPKCRLLNMGLNTGGLL